AEEAKRLGRLRPEAVEVLPIELDGGKFEPRGKNQELRSSWGFGDKFVLVSTRPLKEMYDHPTLLAALARPGLEKFAVVLVGDGREEPAGGGVSRSGDHSGPRGRPKEFPSPPGEDRSAGEGSAFAWMRILYLTFDDLAVPYAWSVHVRSIVNRLVARGHEIR